MTYDEKPLKLIHITSLNYLPTKLFDSSLIVKSIIPQIDIQITKKTGATPVEYWVILHGNIITHFIVNEFKC